MQLFKRIGLFLVTNLLVMITISIVFSFVSAFFKLNQGSGYIVYIAIFSLVWGMGGAFISLLISKWMAKMAYGLKVINPQTSSPREKHILLMVHEIARRAGLNQMPEVGIFDSPDINAFATGPSKKNSLVALSTGLLNTMTDDEIEGVIGHEIAHIANGDMVTMTLITGVVNSFVLFFSRILSNIIASQVEEKYRSIVHFVLTILLDIVFTILGSIAINYFSRAREYRADLGGAKFAGRQKMISGLRCLQSQFEQISPDQHGTATMKISNRSTGLMALFSTHPSLADRISRLERQPVL